MLRLVLSIVGGTVLAFAIVFGCELLFQAATAGTPMPADPSDRAAMAAYVDALPTWVLLAVVAGWTAAALVGGFVAARTARRGAWPGWVVTIVFLATTAANFAMVPHPLWMMALSVVLILAAGWFGSRLGARTPLAV